MTKQNLIPLGLVALLTIILQLVLVGLDCRQTPAKVARNFADAYYLLDADMEKHVCSALKEESNGVAGYLYRRQMEASQRGLSFSYLRHKLVHAHLEMVEYGASTAKIHLTGTSRVCINSAFMLVGKFFQIGRDHTVDETFELVKEDGRWRVCGGSFDL
jgi:hypothetical protein